MKGKQTSSFFLAPNLTPLVFPLIPPLYMVLLKIATFQIRGFQRLLYIRITLEKVKHEDPDLERL